MTFSGTVTNQLGGTLSVEGSGTLVMNVESAWHRNYVGSEQTRFFKFDNGKLIFGPTPGSLRAGNDTLTRRLTLEWAR